MQRTVPFLLACAVLVTPILAGGPSTYKVKKGKVKVGKVKYRIYKKVKTVEGAFGGVSFTIKAKSSKKAKKLAKKIRKYYRKKKINKVKVGKFTKSAKPETEGWIAKKCGKRSAMVGVKIEEKEVTVFLVPECTELESMAF